LRESRTVRGMSERCKFILVSDGWSAWSASCFVLNLSTSSLRPSFLLGFKSAIMDPPSFYLKTSAWWKQHPASTTSTTQYADKGTRSRPDICSDSGRFGLLDALVPYESPVSPSSLSCPTTPSTWVRASPTASSMSFGRSCGVLSLSSTINMLAADTHWIH
jgi:hypothetical protein